MCYFMLARIKLTVASGNAITLKNKLARADFPFKFSFDENNSRLGRANYQRVAFFCTTQSLASLVKSGLHVFQVLCP